MNDTSTIDKSDRPASSTTPVDPAARRLRNQAAAVITGNLVVVVLVLAFQIFVSNFASRAQDEWAEASADTLKTLDLLASTQRSLGFGGMIHNFKNYVLRRNERYIGATKADFAALDARLALLRQRFPEGNTQTAIDDIQSVVNAYRSNLDAAIDTSEMTSAEALDARVRIDDTPALKAIAFLTDFTRNELTTRQSELSEEINARLKLLNLGYLVIGLLFVSSLAYLLLLRRQQQARREILQALRRIDDIMNAAPDPLLVIADDGTIDRLNRAAADAFGYGIEELAGAEVEILVPEEQRKSHANLRHDYLRTGDTRMMREAPCAHAMRKDGSLFPMEARLSTTDLDGQRLTTVSLRNITERLQVEEELRKGQRMQAVGRLTGGIAHDFNNLLQIVDGNAHLLLDGTADPIEAGAAISEATKRATELTARLLSFGRQQSLHPVLTRVDELLNESLQALQSVLGVDVLLSLDVTSPLPTVLVDQEQLKAALINLIANAREAIASSGSVRIEARAVRLDEPQGEIGLKGRCVYLSISDTGEGIPEDMISRVLEPFVSTKDVGGGSGLGLSMVHGFVNQSGGVLSLDSRQGVGTRVSMYFPVVEEGQELSKLDSESNQGGNNEADGEGSAPEKARAEVAKESNEQPLSAQSQKSKVSSPNEKRRILLIEDEEGVRNLALRILENDGFTVVCAEDVDTALELFGDGSDFDAVFSDVMLPGGKSGVDFAREALIRRPGIPLLFASGYSLDLIEDSSILDETGGLLRKPYRRKELLERINSLLDKETKTP